MSYLKDIQDPPTSLYFTTISATFWTQKLMFLSFIKSLWMRGDWHKYVPIFWSPNVQVSTNVRSSTNVQLSPHGRSSPHIWSSPHVQLSPHIHLSPNVWSPHVRSSPYVQLSPHIWSSPHLQSSPYVWWIQIRLPIYPTQPFNHHLLLQRPHQGTYPRNLP